jgi:hypothetical protein
LTNVRAYAAYVALAQFLPWNIVNALQALLKAHHFNQERRRFTEEEYDLQLIARRIIAQGKYERTRLAHAMERGADCEMFCPFGQRRNQLDS